MNRRYFRSSKAIPSLTGAAGLAALVIAVLWFIQPNSESSTPVATGGSFQSSQVARVIDGDTIELTDGTTVRYLSMDTPETVKPDSPVDCLGPEASARNGQLVGGKTIELLSDKEDQDRFGRKLRYVFADGVFVNAQLVWEGLARATIYDSDERFAQTIVQFELAARDAQRGGWKTCGWR